MKITIELVAGPDHGKATAEDIAKNIQALQRAADGVGLAHDFVLIMDTISILEQIKNQLPKGIWRCREQFKTF